MLSEVEKVALAIRQRYPSTHAFCRAHKDKGIRRTTVYAVLRGAYRGNLSLQLSRIVAALNESTDKADRLPTLEVLESTLRDAACQRCPVEDVHQCRRCSPTYLQQAQAVRALLEEHYRGGNS